MRCKCCNIEMAWREFKMVQDDGSEENMCSSCLNVVYNIETVGFDDYVFSDITEAVIPFVVTPAKKIDY